MQTLKEKQYDFSNGSMELDLSLQRLRRRRQSRSSPTSLGNDCNLGGDLHRLHRPPLRAVLHLLGRGALHAWGLVLRRSM